MLKISFVPSLLPEKGSFALTVFSGTQLGSVGKDLDKKLGGAIRRALASLPHFKGSVGDYCEILAPSKGITRLILIGVGAPKDLDAFEAEKVGAGLLDAFSKTSDKDFTLVLEDMKGLKLSLDSVASHIAAGIQLKSYRFEKYRTKMKASEKLALAKVFVAVSAPLLVKARAHYGKLQSVVEGVFLTRDMVSEPPNQMYPQKMADVCSTLKKLGVVVDVLDEKQMAKLGMGALLGVGQGSSRPPRLVTMHWKGDKKAKDQSPIAFVGKGVTFDTGGISLKPAPGMEEMTMDMAGAGAVIGAMMALAKRKAKANVVGVVGLVENMPDGNAQRPGDIVKSMSGQTIEVLNTDAEGRLVLADALTYVQKKFKPSKIIDLATLTGAVIIALGEEHAGIFSYDDKLVHQLSKAGEAVGDMLWRLPLGKEYDKQINSSMADMKNMGGKFGGSITAAQFLARFVEDETPWAHLDIAGVAMGKERPLSPKGASGFAVRLLDRFVADTAEKGGKA